MTRSIPSSCFVSHVGRELSLYCRKKSLIIKKMYGWKHTGESGCTSRYNLVTLFPYGLMERVKYGRKCEYFFKNLHCNRSM